MKRTSTDRLIGEAQQAIENGRPDQARVLLEAAARQDNGDPRPWLMLAGIAPTPRERRTFLAQADRVQAANPGAPVNRPPRARSRAATPWLTRGLLLVAVLAVFLLSGLFITRHPAGNALVEGVAAQLADADQATADALSAADASPTVSEQFDRFEGAAGGEPTPAAALSSADAVPSVEEIAAVVDSQLPAKQVAEGQTPRGTWTPTPQPTPTLAPTATPTPTPEPTATPVPPPPGSPRPYGVGETERWINVDLATQTLTAYEGDTPVFSTLISSGTWEYPTVTGQFRTYLKYEKQTMNGYLLGFDYYLPDVPYVMYFYEDYAIHGTFWHSNFGTPMSHGCVNTSPDDAAWLFNWAPLGTLVNVN